MEYLKNLPTYCINSDPENAMKYMALHSASNVTEAIEEQELILRRGCEILGLVATKTTGYVQGYLNLKYFFILINNNLSF